MVDLQSNEGKVLKKMAKASRIPLLEKELESVRQENTSLREDIKSDSDTIRHLQQALAHIKAEKTNSAYLAQEGGISKEELREKRLHAEQLEKAIAFLRGKNEELTTDNQLLQEELLESNREADRLARFEEELAQLKKKVVEAIEEAQQVDRDQEEKEQFKKQLELAEEQKSQWEEKIQGLEKKLHLSTEKEKEQTNIISDRDKQIAILEQRLKEERSQGEVESLKIQLKEKEADVTTAQQHVAKKVRETAALTDRLEEEKRQHNELQGRFNQMQGRVAELQHALQNEKEQKSRLDGRVQEVQQQYDYKLRQYEEASRLMQDEVNKLQQEKIEWTQWKKKYEQIESLITGGQKREEPISPPPAPVQQETPPPAQPEPNQMNLFQPPQEQPYRKNLFE